MENCRKIIQQGLQDLKIEATETQLELLSAFIQLIEKWNKAYNLTAIRNREDMARLHILDSLSMLPFMDAKTVADIGTGAGLPGIPLAIFCPAIEFTLVDSNAKKTRFVQQAILELKLKNVTVEHCRVEKLKPAEPFSIVIMRAFASLSDIIQLTRGLINDNSVLLAMKGQKPDDKELMEIKQPYQMVSVHVPGVEAERCLIKIEGVATDG